MTLNEAGEASLAEALAGVTEPLVQIRPTVTSATLLSEKSLLTVTVPVRSVFVIVHWPTAMSAALHVPVEAYPAGIGVSVAVQFGSPVWPVTANEAGEASLAEALAGVTDPLAQLSVTVTLAALLGTKSLRTSKVVAGWL